MIAIKEIPLITVPLMHYKQNDVVTEEDVDFKIYRQDKQFKAIPLMSKEERLMTGLPKNWYLLISASALQQHVTWMKKQ
jgi:hypothetical protein